MRLIDRIFQYLHHHRISPYQFERECGIANGYLKKQVRGKGTIGSEILEKISGRYKDLSLTWLITGKGKMMHDGSYSTEATSSKLSEHETSYANTSETIRNLRERIAILESALIDKEKIIKLLESANK